MLLISIILASIVLLLGSITDIKKREVYDYLSYGLIFCAIGIALITSIIYWDYSYIIHSIEGFVIGLIIAYAMFYLGQWGGGDSKLIMGLGAVIGFNALALFGENNLWMIMLLINILFIGAIYGLFWSIYLAIKHRKEFMKTLKVWTQKKPIMMARRVLLTAVIISCILILVFVPLEFKLVLLSLVAMVFIIFYLWIFVKIIEESCMIKTLPVSKLTEGDWIYKNVYINKRLVTGPKDLGISREQIDQLKKYARQGKIRNIIVKEGIPFIPAFFLAFIATILLFYSKSAMQNILSALV